MNIKRTYGKLLNRPIKAYWWRHEYPYNMNFGDELTPLILEKVLGKRVTWADIEDCQLAAVGSIVEVLQTVTNNRITIWGSGFIQPGGVKVDLLDFAAVRGKVSAERINRSDMPLGDPGLLVPLASPSHVVKKYRVGILPHYVDEKLPLVQELGKQKDTLVISPLGKAEDVINDIRSCDLVLSSSLHGLIISDAFGIPNYWMPLSDALTGGDYKFRDYYSVFDLEPSPITPALFNKSQIENLISTFKPKSGIADIQKRLLQAFPF